VERRIGLLFGVFVLLLAVAGARALQLGTLRSDTLEQVANVQQNAKTVVPARRGSITDRRGVPLAVSSPAEDISVTPYLIKDPTVTAKKVATILDLPEDQVLESMVAKGGFSWVARGVPAAKAEKLRKLNIEGVQLDPTMKREYPQDWSATQVIGATNIDGKGLFGLEYAENKRLAGRNGERETKHDATGESVDVNDTTTVRNGRNLQLTLDSRIQETAENVLKKVGQDYQPKSATAIVMDPKSGGLLAVANWPQVNANDPGQAPASALTDRATNLTYEPGSTFKAFTVAGALEDGKVTPDTSFYLPPQIQVADRTIGEAHERGDIDLTTSGILAQSSNVGAIKIGQTLGKNRFAHWVSAFGFGERTGVDLPGEEQGYVIPPSQYSGSSMGNLPIGQGLLVTPMQLAQGYAAIANGGILRAPHIVEKVDGKAVREPKGRRVISGRTSSELRTMLEGVFAEGGTASAVSVPNYTLAGKTGTANKIDPKTKAYSKTAYVASFVGFAPAQDPKLLVAVVVDEPKGDIYGGDVAAPAFGDIAKFALPYLGIAPSS
jgi:cell division protein FtsI (penicillin-binding protein 3)